MVTESQCWLPTLHWLWKVFSHSRRRFLFLLVLLFGCRRPFLNPTPEGSRHLKPGSSDFQPVESGAAPYRYRTLCLSAITARCEVTPSQVRAIDRSWCEGEESGYEETTSRRLDHARHAAQVYPRSHRDSLRPWLQRWAVQERNASCSPRYFDFICCLVCKHAIFRTVTRKPISPVVGDGQPFWSSSWENLLQKNFSKFSHLKVRKSSFPGWGCPVYFFFFLIIISLLFLKGKKTWSRFPHSGQLFNPIL